MYYASMGPRREGRGNTSADVAGAVISSELQWGRVAKDAETVIAAQVIGSMSDASMGPRREGRGNGLLLRM